MHPITDDEYKELPHVHLTSDNDWDPSCLDHEISSDQDWYNNQDENGEIPDKTNFDITGNYKKYESADLQFEVDKHILQQTLEMIPDERDDEIRTILVGEHEMHKSKPDYGSFSRFFLGAPDGLIKKTFNAMMRYARKGLLPGMNLQKLY